MYMIVQRNHNHFDVIFSTSKQITLTNSKFIICLDPLTLNATSNKDLSMLPISDNDLSMLPVSSQLELTSSKFDHTL